jgi:cytoskeletal protein CcmA (bactofilin family)
MAILSKGTTYSDGDQVTSTNLNALVDSATFASDAVDDSTTQLSSGQIIVKDLGISAGKLATSAVTTAKIAGSNVTTAKIAAANITTSLIADSNVTKAKIENLANYKVLGNVSGGAAAPAEVALLDEDNMSSNSATSLATQQSIKAYVDTKLTAEDLDFAGDSGTGAVDLDGQTFTIAGSAGLDTSASSQTLTIALDFNEISNAAIADGDFIPFVDATDSTTKKEAIADIATLFAGTGLSASSSVLSVDASQTQITSVGTLGAGAISSGFGAINNGSSAITTTGVGSFGSLDISGNVDVDGTLETDALSIASTAVTSTAAELNYNDTGAAVGTVVASKTVTVDSNKDVSSFRNITLTGELDAATLDISGNTDIDGVTTLNSTAQLNSTLTVGINGNGHDVKFFGDTSGAYIQFDASADKLLTAGGATVDIVKDKLLIGGTAVTTTAAELNVLDGVTAGTITESKGVVVDGNKDIASFRNITLTGELDAGSLDVSGNADIDGTLEADAITIGGTAIGSIFSPIAGGGDIVTTGALNSGSITSGFGSINNGSSAITTTGVGTFGSLDISGNIDVDGTANLDAVDIDGAVDMASTLAVAGKVSAGTNAQFGATLGQFNGANVAILNAAGQFSIGSTNTAAANMGGSLGFTANTTSLTGYPMGNISGRLIAAGAGVYRGYMAFATTDAGGTVAERMRLTDTGLAITGALSKGSGSFKIAHPLESKKDTHNLVHSFLEGPQADLLYRGRVDLVNGVASVNIDEASGMTDGTFVILCRDVQSFTTNESGWTAVRSSVDGNILTIEAQDNTCTDSISWMVVGERQDEHMYETEWTDEDGKVIVEPLISPLSGLAPPPLPDPEEEEITEE